MADMAAHRAERAGGELDRTPMTEDEIIALVGGMPGVVVVTANEANGAPEVSWGDTFFSYDPDRDVPDDRWSPFATIVTKDYAGFDTASQLDRAGVFRLNIAVGRDRFRDLLGYSPAAHAEQHADVEYGVLDQLLPHPSTPRSPGSRS